MEGIVIDRLHTRVLLRRTGGFGGIELHSQLDTDDLPEAEARWLDAAVTALPADAPPATDGAGVPDAMSYELTVQRGGKVRAFQYTDVTMPAAVRPLVQRLIAAAGPRGS
ncbi:MAG TPA: protealysin inhibitor emfourin [Pilimelia sp.]|nr:protealysin inhibitor emfourin [Pilimelia sp.]